MLETPFSPWPSFSREEQDAVVRILKSGRVNYWTGDEGRKFESEFARFADTARAVAIANGTVALELALQSLGIGPGDEVIVTPRTFLASATSILNAGASPVFADIDRDTQNISASTIEQVLTPATRAIICVHLAGWPCEMDEILDLSNDAGLSVIEDCAQAHGARYRGKSVGSFADISAWSFCQDKVMTTGGEGGMLTTNDEALWSKVWSLKDHGKSYEAVFVRDHPPGYRWLHESVGTNARMTEMQSAIGRIQLRRMPEWHARRLQIASTIWSAAADIAGLRVPEIPTHIEHAAYKCYVFVRAEELSSGWDRDRVMSEVNALGVPCYSGSCSELYLEKAFDNTPFRPGQRLPNARELGETSLMLLCHPTLTDAEVAKTCEILGYVMERATNRKGGKRQK